MIVTVIEWKQWNAYLVFIKLPINEYFNEYFSGRVTELLKNSYNFLENSKKAVTMAGLIN